MNSAELIQAIVDGVAGNSIAEDSVAGDYIELAGLAERLGARDVRYISQVLHGYTQWTAVGPYIRIKMANSDGRRRFALAHECGHLVFDRICGHTDPSLDYPLGGLPRISDSIVEMALQLNAELDIEQMCDLFASELLVPRFLASALVVDVKSMESLIRAADRLRVSLSMMVVRLNALDAGLSFVRFRCGSDGVWVAQHRVGMPDMVSGQIILDRRSCEEVRGLADDEYYDVDLRLRSSSGDTSGKFSVLKRADTLIALTNRGSCEVVVGC